MLISFLVFLAIWQIIDFVPLSFLKFVLVFPNFQNRHFVDFEYVYLMSGTSVCFVSNLCDLISTWYWDKARSIMTLLGILQLLKNIDLSICESNFFQKRRFVKIGTNFDTGFDLVSLHLSRPRQKGRLIGNNWNPVANGAKLIINQTCRTWYHVGYYTKPPPIKKSIKIIRKRS